MTLADPGEIDFAFESEASPHRAKISRSFQSESEKETEKEIQSSQGVKKSPLSSYPALTAWLSMYLS